jgi:hypothetical protein
MRLERDEFEEGMVEADRVEADRVKADGMIEVDEMVEALENLELEMKQLKLKRVCRKPNYQESHIKKRVRLHCCSCKQFTGVKTHECPCGHVRCGVCYLGESE